MPGSQRALRICGSSGSAFDRRHIFGDMVNGATDIDLIVGDWMSEGSMPAAAGRKLNGLPGYEMSFLDVLAPVLHVIAEKGIRVAVNAGSADTQLLQQAVQALIEKGNLSLKTAWVSGDEVLNQVQSQVKKGGLDALKNMDTGEQLSRWEYEPIYAQAYLGAFGVAKALEEGADIVICGRVADASLCMGGAIWWHGWKPSQHNELAAALVCGHLIECSTYVTGANFSGFKSVPDNIDPGLPIAELGRKGEIVITKLQGTGGIVSKNTVKSQLLYEIQGPWYFNSDVTAVLDGVVIEEISKDRVEVSGITGLPPPPTTKVGISALAGYQGELHWAMVGLDVEAKAALLEKHIRLNLGEEQVSRFSVLKFTINGRVRDDPQSQNSATVDFRIFAQSREKEDFSFEKFMRPIWDVMMCTYPGATPHSAVTSATPRPWYEYWVALIDQAEIQHKVHFSDGRSISIPNPVETKYFPSEQPSYETVNPVDLKTFGETVRGPIGWVVHARSGDKGCNANVGFYVRSADEWDWLRSLLTISEIKRLLGEEYKGAAIDRFELPEIWAVHFLCHEHLDRGINSSSTYDILGKNLAEFLRARWVDIPKRFLDRGRI